MLPTDSPPPGPWADEHPEPTAEEILAGEKLRLQIDVDDDEDSGL